MVYVLKQKVDWPAAALAYASGATLEALSQRHKVSTKTVSKYLRILEVPIRPRGQQMQYSVDPSKFLEDTEGAAYWVGFMAADGCVHVPPKGRGQPQISLQLQEQDEAHVRKFGDFCKSTYPVRHVVCPSSWKMSISSSELADVLASLNVLPRKSAIVTAPKRLCNSRHYWRGVIDGDGTISQNARRVSLLSMSLEFVEQFSSFVKSLIPRRTDRYGNIVETVINIHKTSRGYYVVSLYADLAERVIRLLYSNTSVYLDRKYARAEKVL